MGVLSSAHGDHDFVVGFEQPVLVARARDFREKALLHAFGSRHFLARARTSTRSISVRSKGFDIFGFGTTERNWAARSVNAPPVMNTIRSSRPGRFERSSS